MNLKLTAKAEPANKDEKPVEKVTKLAIGKPGGIDAETDKYDTNALVYCKLCDAPLPMDNPKVASLVDSVLLAQSAYN
jgi:ubiquitin carboxyl-terminal hydrolase 5/13